MEFEENRVIAKKKPLKMHEIHAKSTHTLCVLFLSHYIGEVIRRLKKGLRLVLIRHFELEINLSHIKSIDTVLL